MLFGILKEEYEIWCESKNISKIDNENIIEFLITDKAFTILLFSESEMKVSLTDYKFDLYNLMEFHTNVDMKINSDNIKYVLDILTKNSVDMFVKVYSILFKIEEKTFLKIIDERIIKTINLLYELLNDLDLRNDYVLISSYINLPTISSKDITTIINIVIMCVNKINKEIIELFKEDTK